MSKWCADYLLDLMLTEIKGNANRLSVCSAQPTTYDQAVNVAASSGYMLAISSVVDITSLATVGDGTSGRKLTIPENFGSASALYISDGGSATHIALTDNGSSGTLMYITTCTPQSLTATGNVTVPSWGITLQDPT